MYKIYTSYFKTDFGELIIGDYEGKLCLLDWRYRKMRDQIDRRIKSGINADFYEMETDLILSVKSMIHEYFSGQRKSFSLPLLFIGSDFQKSVWHELEKIQYGETVSYLELAGRIGNERAVRAVASANGANAISIIIPCHRCIGSNGELTGYACGLDVKRKLLQLEKADIYNGQLKLDF